jgi:hypothetical protein
MDKTYRDKILSLFKDRLEKLDADIRSATGDIEDFVGTHCESDEGAEKLTPYEQDKFYLMSHSTLVQLMSIQSELEETLNYNEYWYADITKTAKSEMDKLQQQINQLTKENQLLKDNLAFITDLAGDCNLEWCSCDICGRYGESRDFTLCSVETASYEEHEEHNICGVCVCSVAEEHKKKKRKLK